ncbi:MAG TPA: SIS domain-containing protein [Candidatus Limnocylindrales bacterium]|nr:SIS domain-containing protein [Candidatus Limnocylindrales bacterium]
MTSRITTEIRDEPEAIRATIAASLDHATEVARALITGGVRRVYVIGNGTSYHSSLAAALVHRRHARADDPVVLAMTAGEFRHYQPALGPRDAVVGISASGEFRDVVAVTESLRGRIRTVAIVHNPGSSLTGLADHVIMSAGGPSSVPVMTKTFASTLTAAILFGAGLLPDDEAETIKDALVTAAAAAEIAIAAAESRVEALAADLATARHIFVVGSGGAHVAALEGALKLKETALVHAEGSESWEMASGAATLIDTTSTVIALAPPGRGREAVVDIGRHCLDWGARVVEIAAEPSIVGADHLPIAGTANEDLASLDTLPPLVLLAEALARTRGIEPDEPGWTERYRSQGLTHVIGAGGAR